MNSNYHILMLTVSAVSNIGPQKTDVEYYTELFIKIENEEKARPEWIYKEILQEKKDPNNGTRVYTLLFVRKM